MYYTDAITIAESLKTAITPFCKRVEVAGSLRRKKSVVKDIEIVCVPKWETLPNPSDLFGTPEPTNVLHRWATSGAAFLCELYLGKSRLSSNVLHVNWIKPGANPEPWMVKPDGKYWRGLIAPSSELPFDMQLSEGIKLDMFLPTLETWGVIFLMRTGSQEFSQAVMTRALQRGTPVKDGYVTNFGKPLTTLYEEEDVFEYLGIEYVPPALRTGKEAIRAKQ